VPPRPDRQPAGPAGPVGPQGPAGPAGVAAATAPLALSTAATPTLSIALASATSDGALRSADWNTFNGKVSPTDPRLSDQRVPVDGSVTTAKLSASGSTAGQVLTSTGTGVAWQTPAAGAGSGWSLTGNAGTTPATDFIGTTDNQALEFRVNNVRVLRLEPTVSGDPNVIGGASSNVITSGGGNTIGGGGANQVAGVQQSVIAGGFRNVITDDGTWATIAGGGSNAARGALSAIGGGDSNVAVGQRSTVPGGGFNRAFGDLSFAAGYGAQATHASSFVWSDNARPPGVLFFASSGINQFSVRATGGTPGAPAVRFVTAIDASGNPTAGVQLAPGAGSWSTLSDRAAKDHLAPADGRVILERLLSIPVQTWNYTGQDPSIRHMGPTAQDFAAAFGVGEDDTHITTVDADGVALAAIQGLYQVVQDKDARLTAQEQRISALEQQNAALEARLSAVEARVGAGRVQEASALGDPLAAGNLPLFGGLALAGWALRSRMRWPRR
jgi:hypothetical protein